MPIQLRRPIRRLTQDEFGELAFGVMRDVFAIHNEMGRFFDECIYKRELAFRREDVRLEEPIDVTFGSFHKRYFLDVLVGDGGIFEIKAAASLAPRHRTQLLHYLMLADVAHGKLVNVRAETVVHEFVNTQWDRAKRTAFEVSLERWQTFSEVRDLPDLLLTLLRDVGAGLELGFYEEAIAHFCGHCEADVARTVHVAGRAVGEQRFRLIAPDVALELTALDGRSDFESHAHRLLAHTDLRAIAWVNIHPKQVTFTTLTPP